MTKIAYTVARNLNDTFDWNDDVLIKDNCPGDFVGSGAGFGARDIDFEIPGGVSSTFFDELKVKLETLIGTNKGLTIQTYEYDDAD